MSSANGSRNIFIMLLTLIALVSFLSRFADSYVASGLILVAGLVTMAARYYFIRQEQKQKASAKPLNFDKLRTIKLGTVSVWLKENVRGHDDVIDDISNQLRNNIQLARPGRCLGTFLLAGPTGTGKSFLSQLISEALFTGIPPVVLRMNQFKNADDVFTLIGPPPGRPGFEMGGALTRPVLENRFRVIVLDELEKAHPDVLDCLYDILDTASCREKSSGKMVDFSGCIFFATSNAAIEELRHAKTRFAHADQATKETHYRDALTKASHFDRAFVSRWERIYFMDALKDIFVAEVACLNLEKYWKSFGIRIRFAAPELILQTVLRNREFKDYGVRQLMGYLRLKSDPTIQFARATGQKDIILGVNSAGEFISMKAKGTSHEHAKKVG